uniref:Uncharacterized protein n=1 Tax=Chromera velia CCMP2878 TaxID=1169474 RepID=A0A0G4IG52_9ALVE|mmetsp:Transcript_44469/g.87887  ORF Transcript_44469/g.87887 Transcript_44469/m.87887 type:complete len:214 (+) Transcript_44469:293-934(+)|eukprot:Cvel_128.t1-p1 / transcript=Cvel_128.t1 / gene=Cvel_128 / organism=Chromera_velia_CCMP2878 / gene_product=hypothetical protein / transcript_product=hypothetical protein / location=Cvel_scaffold9:82110-84795(+) / protein_length=213 / sequence_SO=supercontig / SO=protein_coding / is_pseudo=false
MNSELLSKLAKRREVADSGDKWENQPCASPAIEAPSRHGNEDERVDFASLHRSWLDREHAVEVFPDTLSTTGVAVSPERRKSSSERPIVAKEGDSSPKSNPFSSCLPALPKTEEEGTETDRKTAQERERPDSAKSTRSAAALEERQKEGDAHGMFQACGVEKEREKEDIENRARERAFFIWQQTGREDPEANYFQALGEILRDVLKGKEEDVT